MKKIFLVLMILALAFANIAVAKSAGNMAPAPNSGDGVSDGSGYTSPNGPNDSDGNTTEPPGAAPNSGDGIPDGSGR